MPDKPTESATSTSLLVRLQQTPADQVAWAESVRYCGAIIHGWCRAERLPGADAQDVLLKLVRAMHAFRDIPAPRFRGWLGTLAHRAWQDLARGRRRVAAGVDPNSLAADDGAWHTRTRAEDNIYQPPGAGSGEAPRQLTPGGTAK
jgi:DNA-directed RNA polymerase specialized sigma24 family protein